MKTIKEILDGLDSTKRNQLMYAFEHGLTQYVHLDGSKFIGVNVKNLRHLFVEQEAGVWSTGINMGPKDKVIK